MSKNIILCLLFGLSLVSCGKEMPRVRATCEPTQWQICDTISLVEDSGALIGRIKDFIVRDSVLLLTDGVSLYLYDHDGRLLSRFGSQGHASSEYIEITRLYATDNHIYAWCGMSLQLLQYSWGESLKANIRVCLKAFVTSVCKATALFISAKLEEALSWRECRSTPGAFCIRPRISIWKITICCPMKAVAA